MAEETTPNMINISNISNEIIETTASGFIDQPTEALNILDLADQTDNLDTIGNFEPMPIEPTSIEPTSIEPMPLKKKLTKEAKKLEAKKKREEMRIKKLENKKKIFRAHLEREIKYCKITEEKAFKDWMAMITDIKLPEIQNEFYILIQDIIHMDDKKNAVLNGLMYDLNITNQQYNNNAHAHCQLIDYSINLFKFVITSMSNIYESERYLMINDFYQDTHNKHMMVNDVKQYNENLLHATNALITSQLHDMYRSFILSKSTLINKSVENQFIMRDNTIKSMTDLFQQMKTMYENLRHTVQGPKRFSVYNKLLQKQHLSEADFDRMENDSKKLQKKIRILQNVLLEEETTIMQNLSSLKHERAYFVECYWILKNKITGDLAKDKLQMNKLVGATNSVCKYFRKLKKRGELLIGIASFCRKLQTEKEKVLLPNQIPNDKGQIYSNDLLYLEEMELFWYKVSLAKTHNIALKKEKRVLTDENNKLKRNLEAYCQNQTRTAVMDNFGVSSIIAPFQESALISQIKNKKTIINNKKRNLKK